MVAEAEPPIKLETPLEMAARLHPISVLERADPDGCYQDRGTNTDAALEHAEQIRGIVRRWRDTGIVSAQIPTGMRMVPRG